MNTIGYLGPQGSFSEEALHVFVEKKGLSNYSLVPFTTIPRLLHAVDEKKTDFAFVPLENSIEGQVGVTLDTLGQTENVFIVEEFVHPIDQCLLTSEPIDFKNIVRIYSHEQALGQCREFIEKNLSHAQQIISLSTAEAASRIAAVREPWAAIGPRRAASLYNLNCLVERIQDSNINATRFILAGRELAEMTGNDKTSLLVMTQNCPGALYNVLEEFARRNINLTRIESRPSKQCLGEYVFYIDVDGYVFSSPIQDVLVALKNKRVLAKLLGAYPKDSQQPVF